nr:reverse transcriptase domain-containing protein, chloroplastic [Tanacetum cinerariifolium]
MQTHSSSRLVNNPSSNLTSSINPNPKGRNHRRSKQRIEEFNLDELSPPIVTMADQPNTADNFELKHGLLTLVQNKQFFGHDKEDPHAHNRYFNKITSTLKFPNVPNTSIKLMLFPFSHEGATRIWLEKEPSRSIFTWDDLVSKFINHFFPPSKTTNLRNEITNFQQRFDESFSEACDRFKDFYRACPYHDKMPRECLVIIESKYKVHYLCNKLVVAKLSMNNSTSGISPDVAELKDMVKALLLDYQKSKPNSCYRESSRGKLCNLRCCLFFVVKNEPEATKDTIHPTNNESTEDVQPQVIQSKSLILTSEPVNSLISKPVISPVSALRPNLRPSIPYPSRMQDQKLCDKANDEREKFFQIFKDLNFNISFVDALILMPKFSPSIKSLLTNKDKLYELERTPLYEHCSVVLLKKFPEKLGDLGKFLIPCDFLRKAECLALADLDASMNLMPLFIWNKLSLPDLSPTCMTLKLADRSISHPVGVAENVYVKEVWGLSDVTASGNPTPYYDPIVSTTFPTLTPFGNNDFLLEEVDVFLAIEDDPTSPKVDQSYLDHEGDILLLEAFLNDVPSLPPPNQGNYMPEVRKELKTCEAKSDKSSIDEPPEVEIKDVPPHLEYVFLEGDDKLHVIIAKDLSVEEKTALIMVLKSHKRAIAWKLSDIKGIHPEFCTHKILMKGDFKPMVQHQRRVNPKIHDVIKQEVLKLLDAGLIYPISDSPWASPVHCVPRKGGFTVVENKDNDIILTRLVMGWRVCIDYRKLNEATRKDHFPLPFMDQILERLAGNQYYCFFDGFSGYFQIPIDSKDQEKTTFTCPYKMFAYRHMPFGLCNAPGTF